MALVADSFEPPERPAPSGGALPASLLLHGLLLVAALWLFNRVAPQETPDLESVSVSIITTETASDLTPTTERSDASQTLLAAGATVPITPMPVETVEVANAEPVETETLPIPAETAEAVRSDAAPAVEADMAQAAPAETMEAAEAAVAAPATEPARVMTADAAAVVEAVASSAEPAASETVQPAAANVEPAVAEAAVSETEPVRELVPPVAETTPTPVVEKPVEKPAPKPAAKPKPAVKPKPMTSGAGGRSDANAQAAAAAPGGSGRVALGGSAAESRYPGLIQAALRRALRFPPNAGAARGKALVRFVVAADGSVSGLSLAGSTGSAVLDAAALDTVRRAAPFPPIPAAAGRSSWSFTLPLQFRR